MKLGERIVQHKKLLWYGVLGVAVAAVAAFGLDSIYGSTSSASATARTVTVERGTVQSSVSASGNVSAATSDDVSFQTGGTVTAVDVSAGQTVSAGQVLGTLDPTDADAALASAQASLSAAQYNLTSAEQGGTTAQLKQDAATTASAQNELTSDQEQLSTDETDLTEAQNQLTADEALGCPASSASDTSSSSGSSGLGAQDASGTTGTASSASDTALTLTGTVDTGGAATNYDFEYGTTTAFGSTTPTAVATPGSSPDVSVSATITGLKPDTTYIYALVVGSSVGVAETATTAASSCVVEQQTITTDQQTVAKDKATITAQQMSIAASAAGEAVVPSTVAQDQAQVLEDQNTVTADQKAVNETTLTAPVSGTVTAVNDAVGDTVSGGGTSSSDASDASSSDSSSTGASSTGGSSGLGGTGASSTGGSSDSSSTGSSDSSSSSAFVTIENLSGLEVVAGYAEADIAKMASGESATVTLPALPDSTVTGTVTAVAPTSTVVSNVVTYDVTIALDNPPVDGEGGDDGRCERRGPDGHRRPRTAERRHHHHGSALDGHRRSQRDQDHHPGHHRPGRRFDYADRERTEGRPGGGGAGGLGLGRQQHDGQYRLRRADGGGGFGGAGFGGGGFTRGG